MIHFLLDTDHVSLQERGHLPLLTRLREHPQEALGVSIVTVQEAVRGRLALHPARGADTAPSPSDA